MKRYLICTIALASLAGCSSAGSLRNGSPAAVYAGDDSATDIVNCVSNVWSTRHMQILVVPTFGGTSIQLQQTEDGPVVALVDITPSGDHVFAKYYSRATYDDTSYMNEVKDCMNR